VKRPFVIAALLIGTLTWLAATIGLAVPVAIAEHEAQAGDDALRATTPATAAAHFRRAFETMWVPNGDYAFRAARAMIMGAMPADQVRDTLRSAIEASSTSAAFPRLRAEFELRQSSPDQGRVCADYERVIRLDPNDVSAHLDYAGALERFGRRDEARRQYEQAIRLNDLLDAAEPERLPAAKVNEIRKRIDAR
jgi:tetratricopeptide (TPR) repeat protein